MVKVVNSSGKHKTATARATVTKGTGKIRINKIPLELYTPELVMMKISEPLLIAGDEVVSGLDINVDVRGGGIIGQANAVRTAVARGIVEWTNDTIIRDNFASYDRNLLVSDSRQKESKNFGGPGARAKYQKSYR
ncbi:MULTISPECIES: 30S ribosomal protein S9 [Methanosarcina]|uniref:Small ribosomal subunit protein uS9 n=3 Tax=Methanosarcina barkeri TaxID=2208 RepID=A0A0E3LMR4_METBA|nr:MULTISPECIES: 30S ribosomal protein S9 [Methanosarcina]AKB53476.1 SSU ribosomal protein S16e (S9p) [Methanosarcina barkeri MS]AKB58420.1 SSU ribosomal protein S16e (S9p) [Methanosarcina barkeri 227]AKJ39207.1 ribosomal protein S9P Rps9p [Methanosarcina barkeri CM1]OED08517.1 30S ribosomal protein S9 [Methanosarcina sp. A14]